MDSEQIDLVARTIAEAPTADMGGVSERDALFLARVLADRGLLYSAPTGEEWSAAYLTRCGSLRTVGTEGDRVHACGERDDWALDEPDMEFFLVRRPVHDWQRG